MQRIGVFLFMGTSCRHLLISIYLADHGNYIIVIIIIETSEINAVKST